MINSRLKPETYELISKRITGFFDGYRQNLAIVGRDRIEVIDLLENCLSRHKNHSTVVISLTASYLEANDFFRNTAQSAFSNYFNRPGTLDFLLNLAENITPESARYVKQVLSLKQITFMHVLELINLFIRESGKKCILVIDDFTVLPEIFKGCLQEFSQFIILQKKCMVILTSSRIKETRKALGNDLNLLFGNFETVSLDSCSLLCSYMYFLELLQPLTPPPDTAAYFINILHSNSTYYHLLTKAIKENYCESWEETTLKVIQNTLYDKNSVLFRKFINQIEILRSKNKDHRILLKLLMLISKGYNRKTDLAFFTGLDSRKLSSKLQCLTESEYLLQRGSLYQICDPLFSFWIASILSLYLSPVNFDRQARDNNFIINLQEELSLFREHFLKEKTQRILDLFSSFKNDTVVIKNQKMKCPSLNRLKVISYPERKMNLLLGEGNEILFAGIKEDDTDETDMLDFISKTEALKVKNMKKIFINLGELNSSARFIAKEKKINVWNLDEINSLLRVYHKPVLI